jgi:hypothetical protein
MDRARKLIIFLAAANAIAALLMTCIVVWFGASAYSYSRQQMGILDAPGVLNLNAARDVLGKRTPEGSGAWYLYLYEPQLTAVTRLAWMAPVMMGANALTLACIAMIWNRRRAGGARQVREAA